MPFLAAAVIHLEVSDGGAAALNQLLKLLCVALGRALPWAWAANAAFTGAAVGFVHGRGYALYWQLGGALFSAGAMLLEMLRAAGGGGARCAQPASRAAARQSGESMTKNTTSAQYFCKDFSENWELPAVCPRP